MNKQQTISAIAGDQALTIAQIDALQAYRDLSRYSVRLVLEEDGWHIDYQLKDPRWKGGGPRMALPTVFDIHTFYATLVLSVIGAA